MFTHRLLCFDEWDTLIQNLKTQCLAIRGVHLWCQDFLGHFRPPPVRMCQIFTPSPNTQWNFPFCQKNSYFRSLTEQRNGLFNDLTHLLHFSLPPPPVSVCQQNVRILLIPPPPKVADVINERPLNRTNVVWSNIATTDVTWSVVTC